MVNRMKNRKNELRKIAAFSFLGTTAINANAVGVSTNELELLQTTLGTESAYQLEKVTGNNAQANSMLTKYLKNVDGSITPVY